MLLVLLVQGCSDAMLVQQARQIALSLRSNTTPAARIRVKSSAQLAEWVIDVSELGTASFERGSMICLPNESS